MNTDILNQKWAEACQLVASYDDVDGLQFSALASRLQPQAISDGFLMLTTENSFLKSWAEKSFMPAIQRALHELYGMPFAVVVEIAPPSVSEGVAPGGDAVSVTTAASTGAAVPSAISPAISETAPMAAPTGTQPAAAGAPNAAHTDSSPFALSDAPMSGSPASPSTPDHNAEPQFTTIAPPEAAPVPSPVNGTTTQEPAADVSRETFSPDSVPAVGTESGPADRPSQDPHHDQVLSSLTFENFVIGESNRMAYSMAVQVAEMPGSTALNPLFIYGKSGLGKTHLMRAIQNYINETQPHLRTIYVDAEELISGYTDAVAEHDREKSSYKNFKTYYEAADVLLVDDIQFLQGKKQTLDIVFQIFNKLTNQGKQIVLSADRAPKNIDIDERYSSRFVQGGTIDIQPPEVETKLAIVKSYINMYKRSEGNENLVIPEDVQFYIAENSGSNIRELKGALTIVIYHISFLQKDTISIGDVSQLLENHFSGGIRKNLTVEDIQKEVEQVYKIKHSDLVGPARDRSITYPRQIAIYLCRQLLDLPFNDIGKKFNRDHTTIMHSVAKVEKMVITNRDVQEELEALKQVIKEL